LTYKDACKLIDALKAENFDANITAGGIAMYPEIAQIERFFQFAQNTMPCQWEGIPCIKSKFLTLGKPISGLMTQ
jgi:hypothetical protein